MTQRNPYLIARAIRSFIFASVLTVALSQMVIITHSIIAGQLLGPDAVSALSLTAPLLIVPSMINMLMVQGASVLASKAAGGRDYRRASLVFSVSMISTMATGILYSAVTYIFSQPIAESICRDARLLPCVAEYLPVAAGLSFLTVLFQGQSYFSEIDGRPATVAKAMMVSLLVVAILDIVFVLFFGMGIRSMACATAIANLLAAVRLIAGFRHSKAYSFTFDRHVFGSILAENVKHGLPSTIGLVILGLSVIFMNAMVVGALGADGMFALSVVMSVINAVTLLTTGASHTFRAVGANLFGQRDYEGMRLLLNRLLLIIIISGTLCMVAGELFAPQIAKLYGADTPQLIDSTALSLRISLFTILPNMIMLLQPALFQVLGHLRLVMVSALAGALLLIGGIAFFSQVGDKNLLWLAFPLSSWIALLLVQILVFRVHCHHPGLHPLSLLPAADMAGVQRLYLSTAATKESVAKAVADIHAFVSHQHLPDKTAYGIDACAEELLNNIVNHAQLTSRHYIDVSVVDDGQHQTLTVKDDGLAFNPLTIQQENRRLGLSIVTGLCQQIDYNYMYGQNITILTFPNKNV